MNYPITGGYTGIFNASQHPCRACERIESWITPLPYDDVMRVRRVYHDVGFNKAFELATQLKVRLNAPKKGE